MILLFTTNDYFHNLSHSAFWRKYLCASILSKKKKKWEKQRTESAILSILGAILSGGGSIVQVKIGDGDFTFKPYFLLVTYLEN